MPRFPLGFGKSTTKGKRVQSRKGSDGRTRAIWRVPESRYSPYAVVVDGVTVAQYGSLADARYATGFNVRNPGGKRVTKAAKREKTRKVSAQRRVALALAKFLHQQNPGTKLAGAKVQKLKGGVLKITPIKATRKATRGRK